MRKLYVVFFFVVLVLIGCHKSNSDSALVPAQPLKPTAGFAITNQLSKNLVLEGQELQFDNLSANAVSYSWNFGNGITSTERNPQHISLAPCGANYTITLNVKNAAGEISSFSQTFSLRCSGKHITH
jgi:hypothetical protein